MIAKIDHAYLSQTGKVITYFGEQGFHFGIFAIKVKIF
jgi:hypothetical protein